jgi:serine/threonine protein kinase/tetratricopeptide (TPR) repeat protein
MVSLREKAARIFDTAVELESPAERAAYLEQACGQDAQLREEVEQLLQHDRAAGSFLESPASDLDATADSCPPGEGPGSVLGQYKLLEQIGEGGFGVVFMAEQTQPVRRKVALKVLKPGMDTRQVVARFEAERQALAIMDHPNIAHVYDGGVTPSGRPYFVMELVKGVPISDYCDLHHLSPRQRLELFITACGAVQHAHQKGIIHRDLKPSNVMVAEPDGTPLVKIIDFGVAKALGQELTDKTLFTGFCQMIGTPLYMSPEQAGHSLDIDTRSDIYSLGVLLYELLTGSTPFTKKRFHQAGYDEIRRIIREEEPPTPSTRLSELSRPHAPREDSVTRSVTTTLASIAAQRHTEPAKLTKLVRGELDWIVMKALEKDRNCRYETANGLAVDLQRYLEDEPVQAGPPSAWYRLRKFVRRNKTKVAAAAAMLALALLGTAVSTWQAVRATRAEQRTKESLAQTREALDALTEDVVQTMFTKQAELGDKERAFLRKLLGFYEAFNQQTAQSAEARFLRAKGYYTVAYLHGLLGEHRDVVATYRQAESVLEQLAAEFPQTAIYRHKLARAENNLGVELAKQGKHADAEAAFLRGITLYTKLADEFPNDLEYGVPLATNHNDLGFLRELQHNDAEAEKSYRHALDLREKLVAQAGHEPRYHLELGQGLSRLGQLLWKQGKYAESEKIYRRDLKAREELSGKVRTTAKERQWLGYSYMGLAIALMYQNKEQEAENAFRQSLEVRRQLADDFPGVLDYRQDLADGTSDWAEFLTRQGKDAAALEPYRQALELRKAIVAKAGPLPAYRQQLAKSYDALARVQSVTGKPKEAESAWRTALEVWQQLAIELPKVADYQGGLAGTLTNFAKLHNQRGEFAAAAALLEKAGTHHQAALGARPKDRDFRESYRDHLVAVGQTRLGLADHAAAGTIAAEVDRFGYEPAKDTYDAACLLARCVTLANKDAALPEARRKELAHSYSQKALTHLQQAVARGFKDVARMKKDPDLEAVRTRDEFHKLLAELEGKTKL